MKYYADLHIHSRFSRATAKNLDLENLHIAAQLKGITVVGTGDFTHPEWFTELREKLIPAEPGLYKLKDDIADACDRCVPASCRRPVRFILVSEISNIYKKNDKTRKNHNLVFMAGLEEASRFNSKLDAIGNIKSDGRPILGLDARNLLEIALEISDGAYLIPAHIWTPWFSLFGSKSGFDSIEACFEDLSSHIFALETGLSSDPLMNWRISGLDELTLVSNSDAHSPLNLGREANLFDTDLSYEGIRSAIESGDPEHFPATIEFFPEEGKYHFDGHRKCGIRCRPEESIAGDLKCPVCEKPLTLGVLHRVMELADREKAAQPENAHPFINIIPMVDILSEIYGVGPKTKTVSRHYSRLIESLGSEFSILVERPIEEIDRAGVPLFAEAIRRMRNNKVDILPGYDGEFGKIRFFKPGEMDRLKGQRALFQMPDSSDRSASVKESGLTFRKKGRPSEGNNGRFDVSGILPVRKKNEKSGDSILTGARSELPVLSGLNARQRAAVTYKNEPLMIVAGPGTGKTRCLTHRIVYLINMVNIPAENILAVTFTNKAAKEMKERIETLMGVDADTDRVMPMTATFHALALHMLKEQNPDKADRIGIIDELDRKYIVAEAIARSGATLSVNDMLDGIVKAKQRILSPDEWFNASCKKEDDKRFGDTYEYYQYLLKIHDLCDYEDLIFQVVKLLENDPTAADFYRKRFTTIFVDEYQDLNQGQYRIVKALTENTSRNITVIGDPDQLIYGFRGSELQYFNRFLRDFPGAGMLSLTRNYRSTQTILNASHQLFAERSEEVIKEPVYSGIVDDSSIQLIETPTEILEANQISRIISNLVGGTGYHDIDGQRVKGDGAGKGRSFSDFAVLYRTGEQGRRIADIFSRNGIPFQLVSKKDASAKKNIRSLISCLKVFHGKGSFPDLDRMAKFMNIGLGKKTLDYFFKWCYDKNCSLRHALNTAKSTDISHADGAPKRALKKFLTSFYDISGHVRTVTLHEQLTYLLKIIKIKKIVANDPSWAQQLDQLLAYARHHPDGLTDLFSSMALETDTDMHVTKAERVSLMTIHASKGLEFPVVFISGCEDDLIPFRRHSEKRVDIDEERRLLYVGMTRAMEELYLTWARKRPRHGKVSKRRLSPFVECIEDRLLSYVKPEPVGRSKRQVQLKLF